MADDSLELDRRTLIALAGAGGISSLAGCGGQASGGNGGDGGNGDSSGQLGERVPTLSIEYWSDMSVYTPVSEAALPILSDNLEEGMGITTEVSGVPFETQVGNYANDTRTYHATFAGNSSSPERLGPQPLLQWFQASWAGANGISNIPNYANCDFDEVFKQQGQTMGDEERRQYVTEMQSIISEDCIFQPVTAYPIAGAYRSDQIQIDDVGNAGLTAINTPMLTNISSDAGEVEIGIPESWILSRNFISSNVQSSLYLFLTLTHSPLLQYGSDLERMPILAENIEADDTTVTVQIRENAPFHNGDEITAEDVKFTLERNKAGAESGVYGVQHTPPYDTINVIDEKTLEINFTEPYAPFLTYILPSTGIYHKQSWVEGGAVESPTDFQWDPAIGSGPYQLETFEEGSYVRMTPFEDHPLVGDVFNPEVDLLFRAFRTEESLVRALQENEIQVLPNISPGNATRLSDTSSNVEVEYSEGWSTMFLSPSYPVAPTKFKAFRQAMAACPDRQQIAQVALQGQLDPMLYANSISPAHPWYGPEDQLYEMAPPQGDFEKAKSILSEAGWGWDDQGRLHYPSDADLTPRWPEGEEPNSDDFPCLAEN